jgi:hypothetical protein
MRELLLLELLKLTGEAGKCSRSRPCGQDYLTAAYVATETAQEKRPQEAGVK